MEHFWKLCPARFIGDTTHLLVEVIHSSNREHRHGLKSESEQGYYGFLWPLTIRGGQDTPPNFDDLYALYSGDEYGHGLILRGRRFKSEKFFKAIEKVNCLIEEINTAFPTSKSGKEVR